jgi:hypothetical protein
MPAATPPGPLGSATNSPVVDAGTSATTAMPAPATPAADAPALDPGIEALDLAATARTAAYALKAAHPNLSFTSGRRAKADQARAMAGNVVSNRQWITETYKKSALREALQKWLDDNPAAKTAAEIEAGLLSVFDAADEAAVAKFSKHLSGLAFDVQPIVDDAVKAEAVKATIRGLTGLDLFLEKEGGLVRWHAQF